MTKAINNPKHAAGKAKASLHCIPPVALVAEGAVMQGGADKYGEFNWGEAGVVASIYYDAILRHLLAWYTGEDDDPESRQSHLAHIRACAGILLDCNAKGLLADDRPKGKTTAMTFTPEYSQLLIATDIIRRQQPLCGETE